MYRKITKAGPATHTISLPPKWIKKNNLEPGVEIRLDEIDNNLLLSVADLGCDVIKRIPYDEVLLEYMIEKLYCESTLQIVIYSDYEIIDIDFIYNIIKKFVGLKIIEQSDNKVILKQILEPSSTSPKAILKRVYLLLEDSLKQNPPQFRDLQEVLVLSSIQNLNKLEHEKLLMIYESLMLLDKPIFDEMYSYFGSIFSLICKQKIHFSKNRINELNILFENCENYFKIYSKKESIKVINKFYLCVELCKKLHEIIIMNQSIDVLDKIEMSDEFDNKKYLVGVCLKNQSNKYWEKYVKSSIVDSSSLVKDTKFIFKSPFTYPDISAQEKILLEFIECGVDVIVLAPNHPTKLNDVLEKVVGLGIKLVIIDTEVEYEKDNEIKHYYIGSDNYLGGTLTAQKLNNILGKTSNVLVVEGQSEGNFHDRVKGFKVNFDCGNVDVICCDFQQSVAYKKTLKFLKDKKNSVSAIYSTSDNMTLGVLQALDEIGLCVPVCSYDATKEVRMLIKSGKIISSIDNKPVVLGSLAVDVVSKLLIGKEVSKRTEYDVELVD